MDIEFDENKNTLNIEKHGFDFVDAEKFFDEPFLERVDDRQEYGEERLIAIGRIHGLVVVVIYTLRQASRRIISLRRANENERKAYYSRFKSVEESNELGENRRDER